MIQPNLPAEPYFSVVIPSRNRPELARTAIASVLGQSFDDFEIIFLENSDPEHRFENRFNDARLRVIPSASVLGMPANWERLFEHVRGRYVILIADKDQLTSRALEIIRNQARVEEHGLITFGKLLVSDTGLVVHRPRIADQPQLLSTRPWLERWFEALAYDPDAPMLYNSAVHRDLLRKARRPNASFFVGACPDIASSIVLLATAKTFLNLGLPLAVGYFGAWSTGYYAASGRMHPGTKAFFADLKDDPFTRLGIVLSAPGGVAETAYACKRSYPDLLGEWNVNWELYPLLVAKEIVQSREEPRGADTSEEWALLRKGVGGLYSRRAFADARLFRWRRRLANRLRELVPPASRRGTLLRMALNRAGGRSSVPRQTEYLPLASALLEVERKAHDFLAVKDAVSQKE